MRLGFSIRVFGSPNLPSYDAQRWPTVPKLSVSLMFLRDILLYLSDREITMYRMHPRLCPPLALEGTVDWARLRDCAQELRMLGDLARATDVRLSFHPYSDVVLNTPNEDDAARSVAILETQVAFLDAMQLDRRAVTVLHVGGVYDDLDQARDRFVSRYLMLPERVRARVVLEHDDHRFGIADVLEIHDRCGVPIVFDNLHFAVHNPTMMSLQEALSGALRSWPTGVTPKIHFCTPRTEMRTLPGSSRIKTPSWTEHGDFVNPFVFFRFLQDVQGMPDFDVMLEAKARDLALLQLRQDVQRFVPGGVVGSISL